MHRCAQTICSRLVWKPGSLQNQTGPLAAFSALVPDSRPLPPPPCPPSPPSLRPSPPSPRPGSSGGAWGVRGGRGRTPGGPAWRWEDAASRRSFRKDPTIWRLYPEATSPSPSRWVLNKKWDSQFLARVFAIVCVCGRVGVGVRWGGVGGWGWGWGRN